MQAVHVITVKVIVPLYAARDSDTLPLVSVLLTFLTVGLHWLFVVVSLSFLLICVLLFIVLMRFVFLKSFILFFYFMIGQRRTQNFVPTGLGHRLI